MAVAESCLGFEVAKIVRAISHLWQRVGVCGGAGVVVSIFNDGNFGDNVMYWWIGLEKKRRKTGNTGIKRRHVDRREVSE